LGSVVVISHAMVSPVHEGSPNGTRKTVEDIIFDIISGLSFVYGMPTLAQANHDIGVQWAQPYRWLGPFSSCFPSI